MNPPSESISDGSGGGAMTFACGFGLGLSPAAGGVGDAVWSAAAGAVCAPAAGGGVTAAGAAGCCAAGAGVAAASLASASFFRSSSRLVSAAESSFAVAALLFWTSVPAALSVASFGMTRRRRAPLAAGGVAAAAGAGAAVAATAAAGGAPAAPRQACICSWTSRLASALEIDSQSPAGGIASVAPRCSRLMLPSKACGLARKMLIIARFRAPPELAPARRAIAPSVSLATTV